MQVPPDNVRQLRQFARKVVLWNTEVLVRHSPGIVHFALHDSWRLHKLYKSMYCLALLSCHN